MVSENLQQAVYIDDKLKFHIRFYESNTLKLPTLSIKLCV